MNLSEPAEEPIFFDWMKMFLPLKKPQATMSPKGGTPAKDKIQSLANLPTWLRR